MRAYFVPSYLLPANLGQDYNLVTIELPGFPKNCNPFNHDRMRSGYPIDQNNLIMTSGCRSDSQTLTQDMIFVDVHSGQRWAIVRYAKEHFYAPVVRLSEDRVGDRYYHGAFLLDRDTGDIHVEPSGGKGTRRVAYLAGVFDLPEYFIYEDLALLPSFLGQSTNRIVEQINEQAFKDLTSEDGEKILAAFNRFINETKE